MIANAPAPITIEYIRQIHGDNMDLGAEFLVPALMQVDLADDHLTEVRALLEGWDYQLGMDSAPAALYNSFFYHLLARGFRDDLPEEYWPGGGSRWMLTVKNLMEKPNSFWWDDKTTEDQWRPSTTFSASPSQTRSRSWKNASETTPQPGPGVRCIPLR
jgi:penicillin G amidase